MVRPGELNLMTAGAGICHSEVSTKAASVLHGVQLWVALPAAARDTDRDFAHYAPTPRVIGSSTLRVFLGELGDSRSPVHTFTPLLGAQIDLAPGAELTLDVDATFEHGVLLDRGAVEVAGTPLAVADLAYQRPGCHELHLANTGTGPARVILLGGLPFGEELVMWWNFVGRSHDDIAAYRELWQDQTRVSARCPVTPARCRASRPAPAERQAQTAAQPRRLTHEFRYCAVLPPNGIAGIPSLR